MEVLRSEDDPVTSALLKNAHFWFTKNFFEERKRPIADYDYAFFMEVLRAVFSEHAVLRKILAGEKVGQFFEDEDDSNLQVELAPTEPRELILRGSFDVTTVPKLQRALTTFLSPNEASVTLNCHALTNLDNVWAVALLVVFVEEVQHSGPRVRLTGVDHPCLDHLLSAGDPTELHSRRLCLCQDTSHNVWPSRLDKRLK